MKPIETGTPSHGIIEEELRLLARVSTALTDLSRQNHGAPDFDDALLNLRDQIAEAKPEDLGPLVEQMMRITAIAQSYGKGRDLPVNPESPYFAHLRLQEDERSRDVLIGKRGFVDRRHQVQIVDWRNAPVSRIYYRYEEGDDYEEHFGDRTLEGVIAARRSLTIDRSRLRRIGCPQATLVADELGNWFEADSVAPSELRGGQGTATRPPKLQVGQKDSRLGIHSGGAIRADKHLPEIAALIDPVQFGLITQPESGLVVLQGGAGSGKTTVALHRVAYLNFTMPGRFRPDRVLVLVLSEAMVRYVERVLPSLGVRGVPVMTARDWLARTRRKVLPGAPTTYNEDTPAVVQRFKKHPLLLGLLRDYVERQVRQLEGELDAALGELSDGELVLAKWRELEKLAPVPRCAALRSWAATQPLSALVLQQTQTMTRRMARRLRDVIADWGEVFTDRGLVAAAVVRAADAGAPPRRAEQLALRGLEELPDSADSAPRVFSRNDVERICAWCARQSEEAVASSVRRDIEEGENPFSALEKADEEDNPYISLDGQDERATTVAGRLDLGDDSLLLYLALLKHGQLRVPGGKPVRYEHLVIDEAQDLSAIEIKVLLECTSSLRSVTLAGDTAQRLVFDNEFTDWETLLEQVGVTAETNRTLRLGYRSTEQIMILARHLAGQTIRAGELTPTRSGAAVELHRFVDQGEAVAMLAEALRSLNLREPLASVALIARYPELARAYAQALTAAEVPNVHLVANQEFSFKAGIEVTDVTQVKGLEFDYVILLDVTGANYPDTLESRHLLYIAATRAAHQLWLVSIGPPSSMLPAELER
jgi:DNA helicase-2/ATP-dependent DNA helicase PcrA